MALDEADEADGMNGRAVRYRYSRLRWRLAMRLVDAVGWWLVRLARRTARAPGTGAPPERILLVQLDHLGDAILTTSILPALRRRYATAEIDVLAAPWNREVFANGGLVDRIYVWRVNRFNRAGGFGWPLALVTWGLWLRRRRYDLAVDIRGELPLALLMWLSGARRRVGRASGGGGFLLTDSMPEQIGRHEVLSRRALLNTVVGGTIGDGTVVDGPTWRLVPEAVTKVARLLGQSGLDGGRVVVIHVSAGTRAKQWPVEHFRELVGRLAVELDVGVILVGGEGDKRVAQAVTGGASWPCVHDWTEQLSLDELAAVLKRAAVFVGGDSGPAHLAAAVGTPTVALFSGTNNPDQWRPWGEGVVVLSEPVACAACFRQECPLADHPCMRGIRPARVIEAIRDRLGQRGQVEEAASRPRPVEVPLQIGIERRSA